MSDQMNGLGKALRQISGQDSYRMAVDIEDVTGVTFTGGPAAGDVAHDAADSGNPVKIGGKASAASPANVTEGDRVNASFDLAGNLRTVIGGELAAGTAIIGKVGIDQTTPGTTNGVQVNAALPAGTNGIGKLTANSGVDIGDVDVASIAAGDNNIGNVDVVTLPSIPAGTNNIGDVDVLTVPRSEMGPGQPGTAVDSYNHASFNLAAGNNQVLVASAANKQIWVYGIHFTVNVAGTVSFQDEDDTAITGIMQFGATGGMAISPSGNFSMPIWKLPTDKDLEVDVVTSELDGSIQYAIVSV